MARPTRKDYEERNKPGAKPSKPSYPSSMGAEELALTPRAVAFGFSHGVRRNKPDLPDLKFGDYSMPDRAVAGRPGGGGTGRGVASSASAAPKPGMPRATGRGGRAAGSAAARPRPGQDRPSEGAMVPPAARPKPKPKPDFNRRDELGSFYLNATSGMFSPKAGGTKGKGKK